MEGAVLCDLIYIQLDHMEIVSTVWADLINVCISASLLAQGYLYISDACNTESYCETAAHSLSRLL